ncbi:MAG: DUF5011 domain-containing protein [Flavobacteriales bacterium]
MRSYLPFVLLILILASCKNEADSVAPQITLIGGSQIDVPLNEPFQDPGVNVIDNEDGNITSSVNTIGTVDVDLAGVYELTYRVSDNAGNSSSSTRNVHVRNQGDVLTGSFYAEPSCSGTFTSSNYTTNVSASTTINNEIYFSQCSMITNGGILRATVDGDHIDVPLQTHGQYDFVGAGEIIGNNFNLGLERQNTGQSCIIAHTLQE